LIYIEIHVDQMIIITNANRDWQIKNQNVFTIVNAIKTKDHSLKSMQKFYYKNIDSNFISILILINLNNTTDID